MSDDAYDSIEHLDFEADRLSRVTVFAQDALEEAGEEVAQVALVVTQENGPGVRVFFVGNPVEALENLMRGQMALTKGLLNG